ncbi:MAG: symmetrical bis(5'-nucleosyl)-tetraphosphatase [Xanthomonadales bacterium]|nr:symmetrical bis(5'-nucleosyl)-tetraphosphatase [Xanthomonadales bacterium]
MAIYLLGDIQGCYEPLARLLDTIQFDPANDELWSCGDLVNRGGRSLDVLRLLHGLGSACTVTLGNHDLHLLAAAHRHPDGDCKNREFAAILRAPDREQLLGWLQAQPLAIFNEQHNVLRMHAGVVPQWTAADAVRLGREVSDVLNSERRGAFLERMYGNHPSRWHDQRRGWARLRLISNILTRIRFCKANGKAAFKLAGGPGTQPAPYRPWYRHRHRLTRDVTVVFGHWAALGLRMKKRYIALDSGCVWGGQLSAVRLEDRALFQVDCKQRRG